MARSTVLVEMPATLENLGLPQGVQERPQSLLSRQDRGQTLTPAERAEAEGLVDMAEWLSLLKTRSQCLNDSIYAAGQSGYCPAA